MSLLLESTVKVSLLVGVALVAVALRRGQSAALRHWILSVAIACAVVAPLLGVVVPSWQVPVGALSSGLRPRPSDNRVSTTAVVQTPFSASAARVASAAATGPGLGVNVPALLATLWLVGAAISLSVLLVGLTRLRRLASGARKIERGPWADLAVQIDGALHRRQPVMLLQSNHPTLLVTWGFARPKILLPAGADGWTMARARIVLQHEMAHVCRGDWAVQMAAETLRVVYWFNPLVWIACGRLRQESEYACDDAVLGGGIDGADYAAHLLDLARTLKTERRAWLPAPAMARPSSLEGRISAMLNARVNRSPLTRAARLATIMALLLVAVPIAGAQSAFSTFSGVVLDSTNRVLPAATVVLSNAVRQSKYEVRTDQTGHFEFVGLPAGEYAVEIKLPGFSTLSDTITIAGPGVSRTFGLQVGSLEETITVTAPGVASRKTVSLEQLQEMVQRARVRQQAALDKCAAAGPEPTGGSILPPAKIVDVRPVYPDSLKDTKIGGVVTMDAVIGTDGTVQDVRVVSSPRPDLDASAVDAVRQWQFTPTLLNCTPIDVRMKVTTMFANQP